MPSSPVPLQAVKSSTIAAVGYHEADRVLVVQFHSSPDPYFYRGVPHGLWTWLQSAPSKGKFLHVYIKSTFPCTRTYPVLRCTVHDHITTAESGVVHVKE